MTTFSPAWRPQSTTIVAYAVATLSVTAALVVGCLLDGATDRPRHLVVRSLARADEVVVSVRDAGIGIDPLHMKHLFNAFFTTKADGMGMGLSICRSIIGAHGGRIWASNNTGSGMTSQFALPLRLGDTS